MNVGDLSARKNHSYDEAHNDKKSKILWSVNLLWSGCASSMAGCGSFCAHCDAPFTMKRNVEECRCTPPKTMAAAIGANAVVCKYAINVSVPFAFARKTGGAAVGDY